MGRETNKSRRERQASSAREKAAAARAEQQRVDQRRRAQVILSSVLVLVIVFAIGAFVAIHSSNSTSKNDRVDAGTDALVNTVASVSAADLATVGKGSTSNIVKPTTGDPALTQDGKPELLYVGAEFCPYCAAERWAMVNALSRFGTLSGVGQIHSAVDDGNLATFTFYKSKYNSKYLAFAPVENEDRASKPLQALTASQAAIFKKYTTGYPFLYFGGKYYQTNAGYNPTDLSGLSQQQIAAQLKNPSSKIAQDILGEANRLTATICSMTDNKPANVCSTPTVTSIQSELNA